MKRVTVICTIFLLLLSAYSYAIVSYSTGAISSSGTVVEGQGALTGVLIITDGTNAATVAVYDGSTSGRVLFGPVTLAGASYFGGATWEIPVRYSTGVYVTVSGTGAKTIVYYTHEL